MRITRTPEQKKAILAKIEEAVESGNTLEKAAKAEGLGVNHVYKWRSDLGTGKGKKTLKTRSYKKRSAPAMLTIPAAPDLPDEKTIILIGNSKVIQTALERLA